MAFLEEKCKLRAKDAPFESHSAVEEGQANFFATEHGTLISEIRMFATIFASEIRNRGAPRQHIVSCFFRKS